jgi:hypothetical protein
MKATTRQRLAEAYDDAVARQLDERAMLVLLCKRAPANLPTVLRWLATGGRHAGPSNVHKRARAAVHKAATTGAWWTSIRATLGRWRLFWARVFPFLRRRYDDVVGRAYRRALKSSTKQLVSNLRDGTLAKRAQDDRRATHAKRKEAVAKRASEVRFYSEG